MPKKRGIQIAVIALWAVGCFWFFQSQYPYHFFYQEQNQLFLMDGEYLLSYFQKPAWLACLLGDFLTQYYYYLYAGPAILTVVLLVLGDQTRRCLERAFVGFSYQPFMQWMAFIFAIALITLEARLSLYEEYRLSAIVALVGGATFWWVHSSLNERMQRWWVYLCSFPAFTILAFWMFGYGFLLLMIFELIKILALATWRTKTKRKYWLLVPFCIVTMLPNLFGRRVAIFYGMGRVGTFLYPAHFKWVDADKAKKLERIMAYDNEYGFGHDQKVVRMYESDTEEKTEEMTFFYCLSLARLDLLPDRLMSMEQPVLGTFYKIGPGTPPYIVKIMNELYYLLGDMTYAERAAMLASVSSPNGRNVRMVKRLAEVNLVRDDLPAAMKYLRLLSKTAVYRQWAADHTPATMTEAVRKEVERKRSFLNTSDHIRVGDDCYTILTQLLDSNPRNTIALDFLLCSDIVARQKEVFLRDYERYGPRAKALYQQALTLE